MGPLGYRTAQFEQKLGHTLARWQFEETGLFVVAHGLMGTSYEVSSTVFFHIKSAESKVGLVDKLVRLSLPRDVFEGSWRALRKETSNHVEVRNALGRVDEVMVNARVL